jgi:hypothetical protein
MRTGVSRSLCSLRPRSRDDAKRGADETAMEGWKVSRAEELSWNPPILSFTIERHGATARGSSRAELHEWTVTLHEGTAHWAASSSNPGMLADSGEGAGRQRQFGRTRRQRQERDVSRNLEVFRAMPAAQIAFNCSRSS